MDISFIIVNWNTKKLTLQAIESIYQFAKGFSYEIILVDNASQDGSQALVKKEFPKVKLIENKQNRGFGPANNQGAKVAIGDYLFFFNSDAYLIDDSIKNLIKRAKEIRNLGAIAPLILNEDRSTQQSGGFFPSLLKVFWWMTFIDDLPFGDKLKPYHIDHDRFYKKEQELDWITGAALLVPRPVAKKTGGFDENIFMYGEEVEWCYRIKKAGFKIYYTPEPRLVHIGRGSSQKIATNAILGEYRGLVYFYKKHKSKLSLQILRLLLKMGALLRIVVFGTLGLALSQAGRKELSKVYAEAFKLA